MPAYPPARGANSFLDVTENPDRTATLWYKKPTAMFAPYAKEGKDALKGLAAELDEIFAKIARAGNDREIIKNRAATRK
jgi:hypothetical protein